MGERKVLNKYYPRNFDPSKIPRRRQPKNQQLKIRMMIPMTVRCSTCGNYIYKGTKFNSRKEAVAGETYLGIQIFRFYFNCKNCSAEITYTTDPKNSDYTVEAGAKRNFEPWRAADEEEIEKKEEELGDAIKSLENKRLNLKQEINILAALDEMKSLKSRQEKVSVDAMLEVLQHERDEKEKKMNEVEKAFVKALFEGRSEGYVKKIIDDVEMSPPVKRSKIDGGQLGKSNTSETVTSLAKIVVHKKPPSEEEAEAEARPKKKSIALQSLFQQYGSDDIDDD